MQPSPTPLSIRQGATFNPVLTVTGSDGNPFVFTGWSAKLQARPDARSSRLYFELTTANGGITISGGNIRLLLNATATAALEFDVAAYDLVLTSPDGSESRRDFFGTITLIREVSR